MTFDTIMRDLHGAIAGAVPRGFTVVCLIGDVSSGNIRVIRNCDSECTVAMLEDVLSKEPALTETLSQ